MTDGGHYENLGLVEALRRRCRLIYVVDGGGDPPPLLSGLSDAIRLARFELGVEIELDERGAHGVPNLAPGSAEPFGTGHAFHSLNDRLTAGAVLRGVINYPAAAGMGEHNTGMLIVAKAVLWQELPDWVLTYGAGKSGESFPNDKTSDRGSTRRSSRPTPRSDAGSRSGPARCAHIRRSRSQTANPERPVKRIVGWWKNPPAHNYET